MSYPILLADDSTTIQRAVAITFEKEDHFNLHTIDNGSSLIAQATALQPAVVLLDLGLNDVDAFSLCESLKLNPATAAAKVILLTAKKMPLDHERANRCGADGHIPKPFETQALLNRVKELLGQRVTPELQSIPTLRRADSTTTSPAPAPKPIPSPQVIEPQPIPRPVAIQSPAEPPSSQNTANSQFIASPPPIAAEPPPIAPPPPVIRAQPIAPPPPIQREPEVKLMPAPPIVREAPLPPPAPETRFQAPIEPASTLLPPPPATPIAPAAPLHTAALQPQLTDTAITPSPALERLNSLTSSTDETLTLQEETLPLGTTVSMQEETLPRGTTVSMDTTQPGLKLPIGIGHLPSFTSEEKPTSARSPHSPPARAPDDSMIEQLTKDAIERIVWEVVPQLAETLIKERIDELIETRKQL